MKKEFDLRLGGFTLIELLVTASIIGVLMIIGIISYQGGKRRARDARRRDDLLSIQQAMEQYLTIAESYPSGASCPSSGSTFATGGYTLLEKVPSDPTSSGSYDMTNCSADYYCFFAGLDDTTGGNCGGCTCGGDSCSFSAGTDKFCIKHLQ